MARIKRIIRADEDIVQCSTNATFLIAVATVRTPVRMRRRSREREKKDSVIILRANALLAHCVGDVRSVSHRARI